MYNPILALPFRREDKEDENSRIILTGPVFLSCGCFTGDTLINAQTGKAGPKDRTIKELYDRWQKRFYEKHGDLSVRGLHRERIGRTKVVDISYAGHRPVVKVVFSDGTEIKCTPDHLFYTMNGWVKAADMVGEYGMKDPVTIKSRKKKKWKKTPDHRVCVPDCHPFARTQTNSNGSKSKLVEVHRAMFECYANGYDTLDEWRKNMKKTDFFVDPSKFVVHHIDGDHYNNNQNNLCLLSDSAHKRLHAQDGENGLAVPVPVECVSVENAGEEDVYDISCDVYSSYTANGFIVHNCGNVNARWATIKQNLATTIPQGKPKSSKIIKEWLEQEEIEWDILDKHSYGIVVAHTDKGYEYVNIMPNSTTKTVEAIADLIKRGEYE